MDEHVRIDLQCYSCFLSSQTHHCLVISEVNYENDVEGVLVSAGHLHGGSRQHDATLWHVVAAIRFLFITHTS